MATSRTKHHITNRPTSVLEVLGTHFRLEGPGARTLLELGAVYSDKLRVFEDRPIPKGTYLRLHLQPKRYPVETIDWESTVVVETPHYLVARKPAGIPVHASLDNALENVLHQLRLCLRRELLITGRLDVPVEGLVLFAKTPPFQQKFNRLLAERKVRKSYRALVEGPVPLGPLTHFMRPAKFGRKEVATSPRPGWLECVLNVRSCNPLPIPSAGPRFELEIELVSGRTHQIRCQLAALDRPILGDRLYGSRVQYPPGTSPDGLERIALFCSGLGWGEGRDGTDFSLSPSWVC